MIPVRRFLVPLLLLLSVPLPASLAAAAGEEVAGVVRKVSGTAFVVRGGNPIPATPGLRIRAADTLETGADGRLGVILRDDSTLSLGPGSSLSLREFRFAPAAGRFGLVSRLSRGTLEYVSGLIGKLSPASVRFDTPVSTIGVRGTHFIVRTGAEPESGK